jgi:hypothetical protein
MEINSITVSGKNYPISFAVTEESDTKKIKYSTIIDGNERSLKVTLHTQVEEDLKEFHGLNAVDELRDIITREMRMEIFCKVHNTTVSEITAKIKENPECILQDDVLIEWVSEFEAKDN